MSNVITATLVRGKTYTYFEPGEAGKQGTYHEFQRNVPVEVSEALADKLEALTESVALQDRERKGEMIDVELFDVRRGVAALVKPSEKPRMVLKMVPKAPTAEKRPVKTGLVRR